MKSSTALLVGAGASALLAFVYHHTRRGRQQATSIAELPATMRAVVVREGKCVLKEDWPTPKPADDEVLIRIRSTAINRLDVLQRLGKAPVPKGVTEVLGLECAGEVVATGKGAESGRFRLGDEVLALVSGGSYAEYVAVHASTVMHKPRALSWEAAGSIPEAWLTAYKLVHTVGKVNQGERVVVHAAASGVGVAAIQLVKAAGAEAFVTVGTDEKLRLCVDKLGAASGAVRHAGPWLPKLQEWLSGSGGAAGVQVILDPVASAYAEQNLEALAVDGRWVLYSLLSGPSLPEATSKAFLGSMAKKRLSLLATTLRARPIAYKKALCDAFSRDVLPALAAARLEHLVDRTFAGLEHAQAAHDLMETNANIGKIVLTVRAS